MPSKVVFVGIDSADYTQIKRMFGEDELPNIKRFEKFFLGRLPSLIPPHTAASWTSMLTGTNPGKHGVFYFRDVHTDRPLSSLDVSAPYIWELMAEQNKRSIVLNVPLTYPVRQRNGIMISGIHASRADSLSVYPESMIPRVASDYKFDLQGINLFYSFSRDPEDACLRLLKDEESRVLFFQKLLEENQWDFGCIVLTSLDRIQHYAWGLKSESEPISRLVRDAYIRIDSLLGNILDSVGDCQDCVTILASDHGFQNKTGAIYPNTILAKSGLLTPKPLTDKFETKITDFGLKTLGPKIPKRLADILIKTAHLLTPLFPGLLSGSNRFDVPPIDYSHTTAYAYSYGLVTLNLKGRNSYGIVEPSEKEEAVKRVTRALEDAPLGSQSNVRLRVIDARDYYSGSRLDKAPDLIIEPLDGYYFSCKTGREFSDGETEGEHSTSGIIGAISNNLKSTSDLESPKVWDVGASILSLLRFNVPSEMDGKPLLISHMNEPLTQIIAYDRAKSRSESSVYTTEEEELIAKRLKDMGYE